MPPPPPKRNGWNGPHHVFQYIAFFFIVLMPLLYLGVHVWAVEIRWRPAAFTLFLAPYLGFMIAFFAATTIDPAEDNVRQNYCTRDEDGLISIVLLICRKPQQSLR